MSNEAPLANIRTAPGQCVQSPTISYTTQQNHVWQAGLLRGLSHLHVLKIMHSWIILGLKVKIQKLKLNFLILVSRCTMYSQGTVKRKQTLRHFPVANCSSQNDHGHMTDTCPHCMYTGGQTWKTKQLEVRLSLACFTDELGSWLRNLFVTWLCACKLPNLSHHDMRKGIVFMLQISHMFMVLHLIIPRWCSREPASLVAKCLFVFCILSRAEAGGVTTPFWLKKVVLDSPCTAFFTSNFWHSSVWTSLKLEVFGPTLKW